MTPFLSVIVPAHNEERRLPSSLARIRSFLAAQAYESELIVVDSGSTDGTAAVARRHAADSHGLRLFQEALPGKGRAVRRGMLEARGDYRFICDADLSMPIEELPRFLPPAQPSADIAIGSREASGARRYGEPAYRHWIGRVFNATVRLLAIPDFQDTQCGFKCLRAGPAEDLFSVQRMDGWSFDVEMLYIALRRGYRIVEIPIPWYFEPGSRVRIVQDSFHMLIDLFRIRRNWARGLYARTRDSSSEPGSRA
ncbi:MAG TPA: dolichyl-phosphate beta-glucosyltransferase [Anaerolineales bacterium]|nr:dolichyl-phosphate beta-glucosyltransferase [Anaerolineales bacterium]